MRIALACPAFKVLGGRERDCLAIARELHALGHAVTVVTGLAAERQKLGLPSGIDVEVLPMEGRSNHGRMAHFAQSLAEWTSRACPDAVVAFEKLPGASHYYAADRPWPRAGVLKALLPRYRTLRAMERSVIADPSQTVLFFLSARQAEDYRALYPIADGRVHVLPVTLHGDRVAPDHFYAGRAAVRRELDIDEATPLLVNVAAYAAQKGVDRIIQALGDLPQAALLSVGLAKPEPMRRLARRYGVADRVRFVGYTDRTAELIGAADMMVHPARVENTGTVIIESLLYGVPVIATGNCGYAEHVARSGAGAVLDGDFDPDALTSATRRLMAEPELGVARSKARDYSAVIARMPGVAGIARIIADTVAAGRQR